MPRPLIMLLVVVLRPSWGWVASPWHWHLRTIAEGFFSSALLLLLSIGLDSGVSVLLQWVMSAQRGFPTSVWGFVPLQAACAIHAKLPGWLLVQALHVWGLPAAVVADQLCDC